MSLPHFRQSQKRVERAARLRHAMTEEEVMLWTALRDYRKLGFAFRRQAAVGAYVADFLCRKAKLIIEVDGRHHDLPDQIEHDTHRDAWLSGEGYTVLPFSAHDVRTKLRDITSSIDSHLGLTL